VVVGGAVVVVERLATVSVVAPEEASEQERASHPVTTDTTANRASMMPTRGSFMCLTNPPQSCNDRSRSIGGSIPQGPPPGDPGWRRRRTAY